MSLSSKVREVNTGTGATTTLALKTKRYDLGLPEQEKRFSKMHLIYKSSANVNVLVYLNGAAAADTTLTFSSQATLDVSSQSFSALCKTIEFTIKASSADFELESMDIDYQILGSNP